MPVSLQFIGAVLAAVCSALLAGDGILTRYEFDRPPADRWELPKELAEISGLAVDSAGRLFAHGDERAEIFELDRRDHRIIGSFTFGNPAVLGDFEGIAVSRNRIYLVTSDGVIYAGRIGASGEHVDFVTYATGLGRLCEIEGLAYDPADPSLLLACKEARSGQLQHRLAIYRWSIDHRELFPRPAVLVGYGPIAKAIGERGFHPSDLTRDTETGHLLLVASREHAIAEITPSGEVVRIAKLRSSRHRQAEGIAIDRDGSLLIADEGGGKRGTLTTYARVE
ncbi:MAG: SdiA-regulated domain-containing protein [Gemmatimonadales bacterium]